MAKRGRPRKYEYGTPEEGRKLRQKIYRERRKAQAQTTETK